MSDKRVRTIEEIVLETADPPLRYPRELSTALKQCLITVSYCILKMVIASSLT